MTTLLALAAGVISGSFLCGFLFGGHCVRLSAREREAIAYRARDRAICAAEDAQAELAACKDLYATPAALRSARA